MSNYEFIEMLNEYVGRQYGIKLRHVLSSKEKTEYLTGNFMNGSNGVTYGSSGLRDYTFEEFKNKCYEFVNFILEMKDRPFLPKPPKS